jgi:hypothetical protein
LAGVLVVCACDAQVTSDYRGERLATIRGEIVTASVPVAAEAALLWWTAPPADGAGGDPILGTRVTTEGTFPSAFTLSVYRLPPEAALFDARDTGGPGGPTLAVPALPDGPLACAVSPAPDLGAGGGARLAIATIAAVRSGSPDGALAANAVGLASDFALIYVASGTRLARGYHLMRVQPVDPAAGALVCRACPPGAAFPGGCDGAPMFLELEESAGGIEGTEIEIRIRAG